MLDLTLQDWLNFGLAALAVLGVIVVGVIIVVLLLSMFIRVGRAKGERRPSRKSKTLTMEQKEELARQNQVERYEKQELDTGTVFEEATGKQLEEDSAVKFQEATELVDEDKTIRFSDDEPIPFLHEEEKPVTAEPAGKQAKVADKDKVDGIIKILEDYEDILDDFYKEDAIMEAEPVKPVGDISTFLGEVDRVTDESSIYTLIDGDKPAAPTQETGIVQPVDTSILTAQVSMLQFAPFKNARINNIEDARAELKELGGDIGIIQRFINQMTDQKEKDMWVRSNSDYENTESRIERKVKEWEEILGKNEAALAEQKSTLVIIEKTKELMGAETAEKDARIMALERALSEERARDVGTGEYRPDSELMVELEATKRSLIEERTRAQLLEEERNILKLAKDDSSLQEEYVHEVATLKSEITRLNRELLTKDDSGDTAALQAEISRLQREIASRDSQPVVDNSGEIEALRLQLIAEAERADNAERAA
ncbi:MAG: hypothetical protein FWE79_01610, partial [Firmicutes bacterium]|nr:hypothetical protein [Bacillota bacterium]